ncbi:MAG: hypothetical protein HDT12_01320 [Helicobacter sp.]|nr:hypothetical protein [Helicobacter sp.]
MFLPLLLLLGVQPQDIQMWLFLIALLSWILKGTSVPKTPKWLEVLKAIASLPEEVIEIVLEIFWWLSL